MAQGAVEERDQDTIGVGHVRVLGTEPGVPYILPLVRAGLRLAGEPSGDLASRRGASLRGSGPRERAGGGWGD